MPFHHVAITTKDMTATHDFYSKVMGFDLVRVEKAVPNKDTWAKHFFYDTGNGDMLAVWEIHDDSLGDDYPTSISRGLGLPVWSNHIAFSLDSLDSLKAHISRINSHGIDVTEIDHGWCTSIYINDPNEIMVEYCVTTKAFTERDKEDALKAITSDAIDDNAPPKVTMHPASEGL